LWFFSSFPLTKETILFSKLSNGSIREHGLTKEVQPIAGKNGNSWFGWNSGFSNPVVTLGAEMGVSFQLEKKLVPSVPDFG